MWNFKVNTYKFMKITPPRIIVSLAIATLTMASNPHANAQVLLGTDNASAAAYTAGWTNGSDGFITGEGAFGQWFLSSTPPTGSGYVIENVTTLGTSNTALNSSGVSFGMYAPGAYLDAFRYLDPNGLAVGQTFSIQMAVNFRSGFKGFDLRGAGAGDPTIFNFNIGGDDYVVGSAATGNGSIGNSYSSDTLFTLLFTQTSGTGGTWDITRSGGVSSFSTGTYDGIARSFKLYVGGTDPGGENYLFVNNLETIPEPSTYALLALSALCLAGYAARRRRRH
jgi:hypothetical protein